MCKIVLAITGASGSIYANRLLHKLVQKTNSIETIGVVMSKNAQTVWTTELGEASWNKYQSNETGKVPVRFYDKYDFNAPFASGSARYNKMVIIPCSMGTMGRIANGISDDLVTRAADVILKERRQLILVARETPYNLIHINNMKAITETGGIICPATPSFYSLPKTITEVADTVVDRVIDLMAIPNDTYRWQDTAHK
ncbi:UbiX family flavin prenyltransferase [Polluticaenibacter yanchengensis]|uniref:Flavin prenyltransferase UbiX n=1 Tax=Polluticaenibacter yanchengensis TaxID=3014562 RepID=A0ABT4UK25_9BACT|nr:UbiX family flavin prenyltransferase [Chitinophagaceae bacterium LY-5]